FVMLTLMLSVFASLISVVNPLGAVPVYLGLTPNYTSLERKKSALHTSIYFILILTAFFFLGSAIIQFFGISISAMRIAGGLVILSSGYALLQGKFAQSRAISNKVKEEALHKEDISFAPMAMPMLSGPGSISLLIGYYEEFPSVPEKIMVVLAIIISGTLIYVILRGAPVLFKVLGVGGLNAISRIMGFLVMSIGIQYVIYGIVKLVESINP
ncbi:MAG TPA: MarC family NAAT transporter, partial [Saprospiraceae bacterium]|nr:MarC family NAAT transporter [Saprospiraceae bacterium]